MAKFDLDKYATVADRLLEFWRDFPEGSVRTRIARIEGPEVVFECRVFRTRQDSMDGIYTSGFAQEVEGKSPVNTTSFYENCESSAIGRALANMGYSTSTERPSRSEMLKVARVRQEHAEMMDWIRGIGAAIAEDREIKVAGAQHNAKTYIRENWTAIKEQYRVARSVVEAIEASTGDTFRVAST
jgi:hypothetical protein